MANDNESIGYTPAQVAKALGCSPDAVRRMVRNHRIPAVQMGGKGGKIVILEMAFIETIERALGLPDALAAQRADEAEHLGPVGTPRTRFESEQQYQLRLTKDELRARRELIAVAERDAAERNSHLGQPVFA